MRIEDLQFVGPLYARYAQLERMLDGRISQIQIDWRKPEDPAYAPLELGFGPRSKEAIALDTALRALWRAELDQAKAALIELGVTFPGADDDESA